MQIWLSSEIFKWHSTNHGGIILDDTGWRRSYQHLQRAEYFLTYNSQISEHDRADCLSNLRKCFTHRLKLIEDAYQFRSALQTPKKLAYLEILAELGIIRTTLIQALLNTRNSIEYEDAEPPDITRCKELVDAVWYLLRLTDPLLQIQRDYIELFPNNDEDSIYWLNFHINYTPSFNIELNGWLPPLLFSYTKKTTFFEVQARDIHTKEKWSHDPSMHKDKKDDDLWITGNISPTQEERKILLQQIFNAY